MNECQYEPECSLAFAKLLVVTAALAYYDCNEEEHRTGADDDGTHSTVGKKMGLVETRTEAAGSHSPRRRRFGVQRS